MTRTQPSWLPQGHRGLDFDGFGGDDVEDGAVGGDDVHVCADVRDGTAACRKGLDCRDSSRGLIRLGGTAGGDGGVLAGELYAVGLAHRSRDNIDEKRCEAETQASIARDWWDKVDPSSPREQLNFHPDSSVGILEPACCYSAQQRGIKLVREFPTFESPVVFPWTASQRNSRARTVCAGDETPNQRRINPSRQRALFPRFFHNQKAHDNDNPRCSALRLAPMPWKALAEPIRHHTFVRDGLGMREGYLVRSFLLVFFTLYHRYCSPPADAAAALAVHIRRREFLMIPPHRVSSLPAISPSMYDFEYEDDASVTDTSP
ncbi:hypothetical protein C8R44DRAFT_859861 [Mycena epipterygia]|nr:hypothetical protein C8R44DRAFT_859861 [Mycena epipterygia]